MTLLRLELALRNNNLDLDRVKPLLAAALQYQTAEPWRQPIYPHHLDLPHPLYVLEEEPVFSL